MRAQRRWPRAETVQDGGAAFSKFSSIFLPWYPSEIVRQIVWSSRAMVPEPGWRRGLLQNARAARAHVLRPGWRSEARGVASNARPTDGPRSRPPLGAAGRAEARSGGDDVVLEAMKVRPSLVTVDTLAEDDSETGMDCRSLTSSMDCRSQVSDSQDAADASRPSAAPSSDGWQTASTTARY